MNFLLGDFGHWHTKYIKQDEYTMQNEDHIKHIISRYLSGEATREEIDFLDSYYRYFDKESKVLSDFTREEQSEIGNRMARKVESRIKEEKIVFLPLWTKVAGVAAIAILIFVALLNWNDSGNLIKTYSNEPVADVRQMIVLSEQPENIYLPDGSIVYLNKGSELKYPSAFTSDTREIFLKGEGYFDVKHDPEKPFIVRSGQISTRVLGTAFNVRALPDEEEIRVTVTRGKVQVLDEENDLGVITPDQQITYHKSTHQYTRSRVELSKERVKWRPEEYSLVNMSVGEVANFIQNRWDRQVEFGNPDIENCYFSATFYEEDSLEELLTVICTVVNAKYKIENQKIIINRKGCN